MEFKFIETKNDSKRDSLSKKFVVSAIKKCIATRDQDFSYSIDPNELITELGLKPEDFKEINKNV